MTGQSSKVSTIRSNTGVTRSVAMPINISEGDLSYKLFRTNTQQTISSGVTTTIINWDEFANFGDAVNWPYNNLTGKVTLPPGTYQIVGGCTWSVIGLDAEYHIEHFATPGSGIFIGQTDWVNVAGQSPTQSFAGVDWYIDSATEVVFNAYQNQGIARNIDRINWGIWRLGPPPVFSCL